MRNERLKKENDPVDDAAGGKEEVQYGKQRFIQGSVS